MRPCASAAVTAGTTHAAAEQVKLGSSDLLVSSEYNRGCRQRRALWAGVSAGACAADAMDPSMWL